MEKLFPTGNQMIDPRILYVNEPGLKTWNKEVRMLQSQVLIRNLSFDIAILIWIFIYISDSRIIICLPSYGNIFFHINSN